MDAHLLVRGADVVTGDTIEQLDVAVEGGVITAVGRGLPVTSSEATVDGRGRLLVPGFIDLHAHTALRTFDDPYLEPKIAQGFTTELLCPDGLGPAPLSDETVESRRAYLNGLEPSAAAPWSWRSSADYLSALAQTRPSTNMVSCVPHSAVREVVMGPTARTPDRSELTRMKDLIGESFAAGCRGLSFGLIYAPGLYAQEDELIELAEVAAAYDAPLIPHVRNESAEILGSMREFIRVARKSGAPLHISHLKLVGFPELLSDLLDLLDAAKDDIRLTVDQYPYGAGSTILSALLPPYVNDAGPAGVLGRVRDPAERQRMARDMANGLPGWENLFRACGPDGIVITQADGEMQAFEGQTVEAIAEQLGVDPEFAVMDILAETRLNAAMIDHYAAEEVVRSIFSASGALVGSDGVFNPHPHPRLYGTAPRVLGRYALREGLITVPEAVARLTSRPAELLGLSDRGVIERGRRADLVLLDTHAYVDTATYDEPHSVPPGVDLVTVGGVAVWRDGAHTGERPGSVTTTAR